MAHSKRPHLSLMARLALATEDATAREMRQFEERLGVPSNLVEQEKPVMKKSFVGHPNVETNITDEEPSFQENHAVWTQSNKWDQKKSKDTTEGDKDKKKKHESEPPSVGEEIWLQTHGFNRQKPEG